jgi:hypothetical protein
MLRDLARLMDDNRHRTDIETCADKIEASADNVVKAPTRVSASPRTARRARSGSGIRVVH